MGAFSQVAVCIFSIFYLQDVASGYYHDSCTTKTKIGKVRDVSISPAVEKLVNGDPLDVTIRVATPFKPKATWTLLKDVEDSKESLYSRYSVPVPEKEAGSTRAKTKSEGSDTYSFSLHLDSFDHDSISLSLQLDHPCNAITIQGDVDLWLNMTGGDLPIALGVPRPFIDLSGKTEGRMKVGIEVDYDTMEIGNTMAYFTFVRKNGMLYTLNSIGSRDPISIDFLTGPGRAGPSPPPRYGKSVSGVMVLRKWPEKLGDIEAMTIFTAANLLFTGQDFWRRGLSVWAMTQVKLIDHDSRPAIGILSRQWHSRMLVPRDNYRVNIGFYDSDGTRLIPFILDEKLNAPLVFQCLAEAGENIPYVAVAQNPSNMNGMSDGVVLEPLAREESPGWMYSVFEAPSLNDKTSDFICSVADGDVVTNIPFRIITTEVVKVTTDTEYAVPLDEETFTKGYTFSCQAKGDPMPSIKFYKQDKYSMTYLFNAKELYEDDYIKEIKDSDRFRVASSNGHATLTVSPGSSPYRWDDEAFRLVCVGANQFTVDGAYVDFMAPNFNMTHFY